MDCSYFCPWPRHRSQGQIQEHLIVNNETETQATNCVPSILLQSTEGGLVLCCFVINHQFLYFDKAAFHTSTVADSSSCVRDGTRWRALATVVMQPLRLNKGLHCCHVKASYPRRAILHKERILHDYTLQTRSNPIGGVFPVTQANVGFRSLFLFLKHYRAHFLHAHFHFWLHSVLGKSHGYLQELKWPISTLGRFTQSLPKR